MMRVKNHQMPPTIRVEAALGFNPDPCRRNVPVMNQKEFDTENCPDDESRIHFNTASFLGVLRANRNFAVSLFLMRSVWTELTSPAIH